MKRKLTISQMLNEAKSFAEIESVYAGSSLFGVTDGKKIGTYIEHKFKGYLAQNYEVVFSSSASGIDLPELSVDVKVTSISQPQSSCPFTSARQKIFGLGYSLLIFVYSKTDDAVNRTANLNSCTRFLLKVKELPVIK